MKKAINPFTGDDKKTIKETILLIDEMQPVIQKAKACGHDCEEASRKLTSNRQKLSKFLTQFFPEESI